MSSTPIVPLATETKPTTLPPEVQAIRRIEQKSATPVTPPAAGSTPPVPPTKRTHLFNVIPLTGKIGMVFKVLLAVFASVIAFLLIMLVLMLTSLDMSLFKLGLSGRVIDETNTPIEGAEIKIDGQTGTTTGGGQFSIGGLSMGTYTVTITANGYEAFDQEVALTRGFLNYDNFRQFTLKKSGVATLTGKITSPQSNYVFTNDRIFINDKEYRLNDDGTFKISNLTTGKTKFEFRSASFKDEVREFQLESGERALPEVFLTPAGDILASVSSYIREDLVLNLNVTVESVSDDFITISEEGLLRVRDLEVGKEYKLRSEYPGYETRDYTIKIAQGENQLFDFRVVEKGFVPFLRKVGDYQEIFVANFDGENEQQLTQDDIQPYGEYIEGKNVYFMSTRDNLRSDLGVAIMLGYVASLDGGNPQRLTTTTTNLNRVVPNLKAGKLANVREGDTSGSRVLEVMNLQGNNRNVIESIPAGRFNHVKISDDGTTIWYTMQDNTKAINGIYRSATDSSQHKGEKIINKENIIVFTISNSGDRVLYSATNPTTNLQDLYMYTYSTKQDTLVKSSFTGSQYQFIRGSEDKLIFVDTRNSTSNLYLLDLSANIDHLLSDFQDTTEGVEALFQQGGYTLYRTNKGLYIIDPNQPHAGKLVTNDVTRYTGFDF